MKQFLTVLCALAALVTLALAGPVVSEASKNSTTSLPAPKKNSSSSVSAKANAQCVWMDGEFEVNTYSTHRTADYKLWIGTDVYEWKDSMTIFESPGKSCHKSGVVCGKADNQGTWVEIWYANTQQRYGTTNNKYDYTCQKIERRSEKDEVALEKRGPIRVCWSWQTFKIHGCFGDGYHS